MRVIDTLQVGASHAVFAGLFGVSRGALDHILERAISRGLACPGKIDVPYVDVGVEKNVGRRRQSLWSCDD